MSQDMVQHYLPPAIQKTIDYYFYQFSKSNMCYNHQMTSTVFPNSLTFYKPMNELFIGKSHRQISQYWKIFIICRAVSAKAITQLITCWSTEINRQPFYSVKSVKIKTLKKKVWDKVICWGFVNAICNFNWMLWCVTNTVHLCYHLF